MTNSNTKPNVTNHNLTLCEVCKQTGSNGAQWLVHIVGQAAPVKVHKPCGELLLKQAPKGVEAKLVPSRELRDVWHRERQERSARAFWDQKFSQAKPIAHKPPVVAPAPPPASTAEAL